MLVRSILSSYSRLLAGASLALVAVALAGCNDKVAEKAAPIRPVLVATVHYEAESPERSFVGTIKPRIETDMGFRVPGKVAKRLVEVGQTVDVGQPLATLDEVDLKLQAEQAEAELRAATGVLAQAAAAENRAKELRAKGWATDAQIDQAKRRRRRSARAAQSRRALGRTHQEFAVLCDARRRQPRRRHRDPGRSRPGGGRGPDRDPRRALCGKGSRRRDPRDAARPRQGRRSHRDAVVRAGQEICRETARGRARRPIPRRAPIWQNFRCPMPATAFRSA